MRGRPAVRRGTRISARTVASSAPSSRCPPVISLPGAPHPPSQHLATISLPANTPGRTVGVPQNSCDRVPPQPHQPTAPTGNQQRHSTLRPIAPPLVVTRTRARRPDTTTTGSPRPALRRRVPGPTRLRARCSCRPVRTRRPHERPPRTSTDHSSDGADLSMPGPATLVPQAGPWTRVETRQPPAPSVPPGDTARRPCVRLSGDLRTTVQAQSADIGPGEPSHDPQRTRGRTHSGPASRTYNRTYFARITTKR